MANLKEIRSRITSIGSTMQITNAMKMVSAAKLKKAQDTIEQMRPYAEKLRELMNNVSSATEGSVGGVYTQEREEKNVLLVVVTSNRGLAGAFNSNIVKEALRAINNEYREANVKVMTIGKKGHDILKKSVDIYAHNTEFWDNFSFANSSEIAEEIMHAFKDQHFDVVRVIYNQFKNAATQIVKSEQFLPISLDNVSGSSTSEETNVDYLFEPNKEDILNDLIPKTLKTQLYKALADSYASEHGARMTAMHKATDNADELRRDLTLVYNKARQAAITNEITEIVGGADALEG